MRSGGDTLPAQLLRQPAERSEIALELRPGDERAAAPPDRAPQQAARLERLQRLTHRHAADAVLGGELALGRQPVAGREPTLRDRVLDLLHDLRVLHARIRSPFGS